MLLRFSLLILLLTMSCARERVTPTAEGQTATIGSPTPNVQSIPESNPNSPIRSVDFENFTYPEIEERGTFNLKDGREPTEDDPRSVIDVVYGDVNADGVEDAMVVQTRSIRGSAIPRYVYVYGFERKKPKLLWSFYAGERGDGGLRQIVADRGEMMVELYGRDRVVNGGTSSDEDNIGVCCPRFFTRSRYEWRNGRFRLKSKEAALSLGQDSAASYLSSDR